MRLAVLAPLLVMLAACSAAPIRAPAPVAATDPNLEFLLQSSAKDFHHHQPPRAAGFRDVRFGHHTAPDGEVRYLLCGEVLAAGAGAPAWTPFVTIKTGDFEQWLGAQAVGWCQGPALTWDGGGDLSPALQARLDALR